MWGLVIGACIALVAIGLRVEGKVNNAAFSVFLLVAFGSGMAIAYFGSTKKFKASTEGFEIELQEKADAITKDTLAKISQRVAVQEEALSSVIKKADDTRQDLLKVAELAAPPLLSFASKEIKRTDEGYELIVQLTPSKNAPFGTLMIAAEIGEGSEATIVEFGPGVAAATSPLVKSPDGKRAAMQYSPLGSQIQKPRLVVSAPCKARISCSHMREPLEIEIK